MILVDADQGGRIVRHDGHARVHDGATMALVREARRSTVQQTGNDAFDYRSAVPTGTRQVHLGGGSYVVQVRLVQDLEHVLRCRRRGEGIDSFRDPHGENPPLMQCLPQGDVIQRHIASQRVDGRGGARPDPGDRLLYCVDQGLHVTGITRIPHGQMQGKDEASRRFGNNARLAAELRGAIAFALANRRNRGIVRVDNFAVGQHLALRQPAGLVFDPLMGREGGGKLGVQARPLVLRQLWHTVQALLHGPSQGQDLASTLQQLRLGLAYQRHKHFSHPSTLPADAAHHLLEVVLQVLRVRLQRRALGGALRGDGRGHLEDFFGALYSVAASLTRWLPCSLGKVSTTTWAGLTSPSSIAVAAWIASSSAINGSSRRRRHWASTSGSTTWSWVRSTWTAVIPQADLTARSVRNRLQICSSEQANSCFRSSNANNTRVETGGRPRVVGLGKRWANERSTAATRAAHGKVSAHWRMGCVSGTKSATCRRGPRPVSQCWRYRKSCMVGSPDRGGREPQHTTIRSTGQSPLGGNKLVVTK